jgi:hypothetical protein
MYGKKKQKNSHPGVSDETVLTDPFVLSGVGSGLAHRRSGWLAVESKQ